MAVGALARCATPRLAMAPVVTRMKDVNNAVPVRIISSQSRSDPKSRQALLKQLVRWYVF